MLRCCSGRTQNSKLPATLSNKTSQTGETIMGKALTQIVISALILVTSASAAAGQTKPRARDLGVPFDGKPGPFNTITDVKGVEVGHTTLISGEGALKVGTGPVRT